jgi:hypothetical protein
VRTRRLFLAAAAFSAIFAGGTAQANPACVSWWVQAPIIGRPGSSHCAPTPFAHGITWYMCSGTPPIGESHCVTVVIQTPF